MKQTDFKNPEIQQIFECYSNDLRNRLLKIRNLIFKISEECEHVGKIDETIKWGVPSYVTYSPKSGTTVRMSGLNSSADKFGLYVHCQTTLISDFKLKYPNLNYDGTRAIIFNINDESSDDIIKHFLLFALTYHIRKKIEIM